MTQDKEILKQLVAIVANQQKILTKLAQQLPTDTQHQVFSKREAETILNALSPAVRAAVQQLEVQPGRDSNVVKVRFVPQKNTPAVFNALQKTVQDLQSKNMLPGTSYVIQEVA